VRQLDLLEVSSPVSIWSTFLGSFISSSRLDDCVSRSSHSWAQAVYAAFVEQTTMLLDESLHVPRIRPAGR